MGAAPARFAALYRAVAGDMDVVAVMADNIGTTSAFGGIVEMTEDNGGDDVWGLCGEPGADKMAKWTGGGKYWPGECASETEMVHSECEAEECRRAHSLLSQKERDSFLRSI